MVVGRGCVGRPLRLSVTSAHYAGVATIDTPHLLTVAEVQARLRISRRTAYRLIERGDLPALRIGGSVRVDSDELEVWLYGKDGR